MAALSSDGIAADDSSERLPSMPAAMTASDGGGILRGPPPFPTPPSSLPSPTVELSPAVAYIEAIRRSTPPTPRLVTAEELATWPEWRLVGASPTVAAWMAPVSPNEPADPTADDLDDSLLSGLTALSLDAAYATEGELRAVAAPSIKSTPPPWVAPLQRYKRQRQSSPPRHATGTWSTTAAACTCQSITMRARGCCALRSWMWFTRAFRKAGRPSTGGFCRPLPTSPSWWALNQAALSAPGGSHAPTGQYGRQRAAFSIDPLRRVGQRRCCTASGKCRCPRILHYCAPPSRLTPPPHPLVRLCRR